MGTRLRVGFTCCDIAQPAMCGKYTRAGKFHGKWKYENGFGTVCRYEHGRWCLRAMGTVLAWDWGTRLNTERDDPWDAGLLMRGSDWQRHFCSSNRRKRKSQKETCGLQFTGKSY
jgi:hypothetical protein